MVAFMAHRDNENQKLINILLKIIIGILIVFIAIFILSTLIIPFIQPENRSPEVKTSLNTINELIMTLLL